MKGRHSIATEPFDDAFIQYFQQYNTLNIESFQIISLVDLKNKKKTIELQSKITE